MKLLDETFYLLNLISGICSLIHSNIFINYYLEFPFGYAKMQN